MSRSQLKNYGPRARNDFIDMVTRQAAVYGLTKEAAAAMDVTGDTVLIQGTAYTKHVAQQRGQLENLVKRDGFDHTMEAMAYTWFNRFMAIRYMEIHGYLDHGYRVLSHPSGDATPEILQHADHIDLPGLDKQAVIDLKLDGTKDTELYRTLLMAQCNALHAAMPFLFEKIDDATELLLPADLLHSESVIRKMVEAIDEEDWQEVEIVGWLYQFYISEKKDEVIGKVVKSEDIPAATQLFTPNWIVKYMVQNSLGAKWLATYPDSPLKGKMEYYIDAAEQDEEVQQQLKAITPDSLNPEEITLLDPACGSGHILVEAYELFKAIYQERGYRAKDIPRLILEKNLYGLEIDERAAQLASFALLMKARADDRSLFNTPVKLNTCCIQESNNLEIDDSNLKSLFHNAKTYGSLIRVNEDFGFNLEDIEASAATDAESDELFVHGGAAAKAMLLRQAKMLVRKYDVVVANPPYMGGKGMCGELKNFLKDCYADVKSDTFSAFIERDRGFARPDGQLGIMCPFVWMFISSYEELRHHLIDDSNITSLVQLEYSGFEGATVPICTFTLSNTNTSGFRGSYVKLSDFRGADNQGPKTLEAINNKDCGWFFNTRQEDFKKIPGSPIAYWVSEQVRRCFTENAHLSNYAFSNGKNITGDNERFQRWFWEVSSPDAGKQSKWAFIAKGGGFKKWRESKGITIDWSDAARSHYRSSSVGRLIPEELWFRDGITWGLITSSRPSFRVLTPDFTFSDVGLFFNDETHITRVLAFLNSKVADFFLGLLNPTLNYPMEIVLQLPVSNIVNNPQTSEYANEISILIGANEGREEANADFEALSIVNGGASNLPTLKSSYTAWITQNRETIAEMKRLEEENNRFFIDAYGLADELTPDVPIEQITLTVNPAYRYGGKITVDEQWTRFRTDTMQELLSYAIGGMMGRYSLDAPGLLYARSGNEGFDASKVSVR
jgi:hypothetical protein